MELPIFPLNAVLFPGGLLPLRIFEQRYMGMAKDCLARNGPFGVCLIAAGSEVGAPATPHSVGSLANIVHWDMQQLGVLLVRVSGGQRFRILAQQADSQGLIRARTEWIEPDVAAGVPAQMKGMVELLRAIVDDAGPDRMPAPHHYDDAAWVGYRFSEVLPIQNLARQKLLELDDPVSRLEIIYQYLAQRQMVS